MDKSLKDRVLSSLDIVEIVGESVSLKRKGKDFVGLCPFHPDHTPSMGVSPTKQIFKCWSCGAAGDAIKFVMLKQRVGFRDALEQLARRLGIEFRREAVDPIASAQRDELRRVMTWARQYFRRNLIEGDLGASALDYARRRGLTDETMETFQIGFAPESWDMLTTTAQRTGISPEMLDQAGLVAKNIEKNRVYDRFRNRLIFPICDPQGRVVAFGGRALGDDPAKYLNSPETPLFSKSRILYAMDVARPAMEKSREAIVCEGYMDAVMLHQGGFTNAVAVLGTAMSDIHAKALTQVADRIYMCFDNDDAGRRAADRAVEAALVHKADVRVVTMVDGKDPADCIMGAGPNAFKSLLSTAIGALEFKWTATLKSFENGSSRGKRDAVERFLSFVAKVSVAGGIDPLEQGLIIGRLAELLAMPARSVQELLDRARSNERRPSASANASEVVDAASAYDEAIRGLAPGLVVVAEELLGLVLAEPAVFERMRGGLESVAERCETWGRLLGVMERLWENEGQFAREEVIAACDDETLCDLVNRASERVGKTPATDERCEAASDALHRELEMMRGEGLRDSLGNKSSAGEQANADFRSFLEVMSKRQDVLGAEHRWNAATASS
ncbi:MAG: DNA primase [Phycisphaerae bacterium]